MSASKFGQVTEPSALTLHITWSEDMRQCHIENTHSELRDFKKEYVNFGGFFGKYDPQIFAAAPEMFKALEVFAACADELDGDEASGIARAPDQAWARFRLLTDDYRRARDAINKALGK